MAIHPGADDRRRPLRTRPGWGDRGPAAHFARMAEGPQRGRTSRWKSRLRAKTTRMGPSLAGAVRGNGIWRSNIFWGGRLWTEYDVYLRWAQTFSRESLGRGTAQTGATAQRGQACPPGVWLARKVGWINVWRAAGAPREGLDVAARRICGRLPDGGDRDLMMSCRNCFHLLGGGVRVPHLIPQP